jgi:hypothetical protein
VKPEILFGNLYLDYTDPRGDYAKMKLNDLKNGTQPGEAASHIRSRLNDEGLFRNIQDFTQEAGNSIRKFTSGNFF